MSLPSALQPNNLSDREDASIMTNLSISRTAYSGISENLHETIDKPGIPPDIPPFGDQEERYDWITSILRVVAHGITRQEEDSLHAHKSSGEMEDEKNGPGSQELDTSKSALAIETWNSSRFRRNRNRRRRSHP
ncbi:uncharacterized protein I206_105043 [Kwoniella pini CBS 10737]|uniref:Uncharacterized protein n=1 Tax=Kwoniella pini CBS 10737 TaxID=1296096 RepID=A0A1B9I8I6_9TREE|nr:uncharacterized protein I206_02583 [Kwoniella pini CBS 10737]OCF51867.1 hypothetical protein I206_02583 [Kwoniella pini CBS 10737]